MKIAVITGASSGIGEQFVYGLDKHEQFDEIWVIARRRENLEKLSAKTRSKIRPVPLDLTVPESFDEYSALLENEKPTVTVLVNCSGFGLFGAFLDRPLSKQLDIIDLNDKAVVAMTYLTLPYMSMGSQVINIASSAAFQPVPYETIYAASKAFVLNFSRAVNMEMKPRGIHIMAVCPNWCKTEFFDTAVTDDTIVYYNFFNSAEDVVETAIRDMKKGRDVSLSGRKIKFQLFFIKHMPVSFIMKTWCKQQKKPY